MKKMPRALSNTFFNWKELTTSIIQGLMITVGSMLAYQYAVQQLWDEATTRTMVFTVLIAANILLTLVNRSFYYSLFTTLRYKNNLVIIIILITIAITGLLIFVPPLTTFFGFAQLTINQILISIGFGFASVIWYELIKLIKRLKKKGA
jgi:Ca2+-transporting ATPase